MRYVSPAIYSASGLVPRVTCWFPWLLEVHSVSDWLQIREKIPAPPIPNTGRDSLITRSGPTMSPGQGSGTWAYGIWGYILQIPYFTRTRTSQMCLDPGWPGDINPTGSSLICVGVHGCSVPLALSWGGWPHQVHSTALYPPRWGLLPWWKWPGAGPHGLLISSGLMWCFESDISGVALSWVFPAPDENIFSVFTC